MNVSDICKSAFEFKTTAEFFKHVETYPSGYIPANAYSDGHILAWKAIIDGNVAVWAKQNKKICENPRVLEVAWILCKKYKKGFGSKFMTELIDICRSQNIAVAYRPSTTAGSAFAKSLEQRGYFAYSVDGYFISSILSAE